MTGWLATPWTLAMLALLPLLIMQRASGARWPLQKARAWCALMGASLLSWEVTTSGVPIVQYIAIDALAALLLLWPPANTHMRRIALLFGVMVGTHIGFALGKLYWGDIAWGATVAPGAAHWAVNSALGWVQFALLAWWGGEDVGRFVRNRGWLGDAGGNHRRVPDIRGRG